MKRKLRPIFTNIEKIAINVGVLVSLKEKNALNNKGIKDEARIPMENKAKLEEDNCADKEENKPFSKSILTICFLKTKIRAVIGKTK